MNKRILRFGSQAAVRRGNWKLVRSRDFAAKVTTGWELYDLASDVGESRDLAAQRPELVAELTRAWEKWNGKNITPRWHGTANEDPTAPVAPAAKGKAKAK